VFTQDFILNGAAHGPVAERLSGSRFDLGLHRPFYETNPSSPRRNHPCVVVNTGQVRWNPKTKQQEPILRKMTVNEAQRMNIPLPPVVNATTLRKEEWDLLDTVVLRAARYRLRAWSDLAGANSFGGFNGMSKMILEHETMSDPGEAITDMDGLGEGRKDAPLFQLQGLPLPITHSDFWFSSRQLAISRNSGTPLDVSVGEAAGRRVAESIEKVTIGSVQGITYGGNSTQVGGYGRTSTVWGYTNFTNRITKSGLYKPTGNGRSGTGWVPADTLKDVLAVRDLLYAHKFYGPFMLYHSNDWDQYMDNDYFLTSAAASTPISTKTLRERLQAIQGITDVRRLDFLFSSTVDGSSGGPGLEGITAYAFTLLFVQMTPDVARAVNGMDITTVQWETVGGMKLNFKVMCIQVPQLRADYYGNAGICHATATI
jgi:hypothetical protein